MNEAQSKYKMQNRKGADKWRASERAEMTNGEHTLNKYEARGGTGGKQIEDKYKANRKQVEHRCGKNTANKWPADDARGRV